MRKINYYRMLLGGISLLGLANVVQAQCVTPPTCSELGYTKTASECSGHTFLKCPFDTSVGYCDEGALVSGIDPNQEYKVGSSLIIDGIPVGTIVYLDSTGKHGIVAVSKGQANAAEATSICINLKAGGLNWGLASGRNTCTIAGNVTATCNLRSIAKEGYCHRGSFVTDSVNCNSETPLGFVCEAAF